MNIDDYLSEEKTIYSFTDESGDRSTITVEKWVGDLLQACLPDVHAWIQNQYNKVFERLPLITRRQRGDVLRELAKCEAANAPGYIPLTKFL